MKIQTTRKNRKNISTKLAGVKVDWDSNGIAEISDELWNDIEGKYNDIYPFGKVPKEPVKPVVEEEKKDDQSTDVVRLKKKLEEQAKTIKDLQELAQGAIDENDKLKENCNLYEKEIGELRDKLVSISESDPDKPGNGNVPMKEVELIHKTSTSTKTELRNTCDELGFPSEEWGELTHKDLVLYVLNKLYNNADNNPVD